MNKKIILSLQSLRVLGFILIFLNHIKDLLPFNIPDLGARGVEIFFILSGFTIAYNYCTSTIKCTFNSCFNFCFKRVKKFYFIHLLTFVLAAFLFLNNSFDTNYIKTALCNLLLLQSWIPSIMFSFNGVSWFLSSLLFCYFITPIILNLIKSLKTTFNIILFLGIIILIKILFETFWIQYINWESGFMFHVFPIYKLTEYTLGCLLGTIFINSQKQIETQSTKIINIMQISSIIFYSIAVLIGDKANWYRCLYIPFAIFLIYSIAIEKGTLYKFLANKILLHFSSIGLELFMLHQLILNYVINFTNMHNSLFIISLTLVLTILLSELIHYILISYSKK